VGGKAVRLCPRRETQLRVWCSVSDLRQSFFPRSSSAYNIQTHRKRERRRRRRRRREREIIDAWEEVTEVGSERRECGGSRKESGPIRSLMDEMSRRAQSPWRVWHN